jgi:hypothetical protein
VPLTCNASRLSVTLQVADGARWIVLRECWEALVRYVNPFYRKSDISGPVVVSLDFEYSWVNSKMEAESLENVQSEHQLRFIHSD